MDTLGRITIFNLGKLTIGNFYLPAGRDTISKNIREESISTIIPNLMMYKKESRMLLGDWNYITVNQDCTKYPEA